MAQDLAFCVQRQLNYAIVDEVDSILIDEARTPLIISGSAEQSADLYHKVDGIIPGLPNAVGNWHDPANIERLHHVTQAIKEHTLYKRDVNYLIEDGEVIIVDEFTGRK